MKWKHKNNSGVEGRRSAFNSQVLVSQKSAGHCNIQMSPGIQPMDWGRLVKPQLGAEVGTGSAFRALAANPEDLAGSLGTQVV